jgi:hypothetical protein
MNKLLTNLAILAVVIVGGRYVVNIWSASRFMDHVNQCHAELHIGDRIHRPMSHDESEAMYAEFEKCVGDRSNFLDARFNKGALRAYIDALKTDR